MSKNRIHRKSNYVLPLVAALAACSVTTEVSQETEAVRDYIATADLAEVTRVRAGRNTSHKYISDHFVIIEGEQQQVLAEFSRRCYDLTRSDFTPQMVDTRRDPSHIHAKFDTIRGCHIDKLYGLTPEQAEELRNLGDAPGDEVFMPDNDDS